MKKNFVYIMMLFILSTISVYISEDDMDIKPVKIINQKNVFNIQGAKFEIDNKDVDFKNSKNQNIEIKITEADTNENNKKISDYSYNVLNWNQWRSRFLNQILDDSDKIKTLDYYGFGSWFYFSFVVENTGKIGKIKLFSFCLTNEDKKSIKDMIYNYAYTDITKFPKYSKRKSVVVKSFFFFGNSEKRARPEDFFDGETIKIQH